MIGDITPEEAQKEIIDWFEAGKRKVRNPNWIFRRLHPTSRLQARYPIRHACRIK